MELAWSVGGVERFYKRWTNLIIIDRQVLTNIAGVGVPAPVGDHHRQGGGDEDCDGEAGVGVATIQEAEH